MKITLNLEKFNEKIKQEDFKFYNNEPYNFDFLSSVSSGGTNYQALDSFENSEMDKEPIDREMLDFLSKI